MHACSRVLSLCMHDAEDDTRDDNRGRGARDARGGRSVAGRSGKHKVLGVARVGVAVGRRCSVGGPGRARGERGKQPTTERGVDIAVRTGAGAHAVPAPAVDPQIAAESGVEPRPERNIIRPSPPMAKAVGSPR